jgi:hypothetical protein
VVSGLKTTIHFVESEFIVCSFFLFCKRKIQVQSFRNKKTEQMKKIKLFVTIATLIFLGVAFSNPSNGQTVNYPTASGITWYGGETYIITWSGFYGSTVKIRVYKANSLFATITNSTPNDGAETWNVPKDQYFSGSEFKIRIISAANENVFGESNNWFTINQPEVIYPSVKDITWYGGLQRIITWSGFRRSDSYGSNVKIELFKGGALYYIITPSTDNNGSYDWTVPTSLLFGSDYKIRITSASNWTAFDESDNYFTIVPARRIP